MTWNVDGIDGGSRASGTISAAGGVATCMTRILSTIARAAFVVVSTRLASAR